MFPRTKLQPPAPRVAFIVRSVVQARLSQALRARRLVLLCAPAGYGKTAALAYEIARLPADHAAAWVSADVGDDLQVLLRCMLAALEPFDPPWRIAPEALVQQAADRSPAAQRTLLAEIVNTLDACEVVHGVIVFDDVHRVVDPAFFRFLDALVERLSARWTVALTSRSEPPLGLARLRAREELAEFRQLQLQFARDEAHALARQAGLDACVADRLFDRTHGWPAGLRMAIGALRAARGADGADGADGPDAADGTLALRASERPLFEFLVSEVLVQLPAGLADFLIAVSVLPELQPARCAAVTGDPQAALRLEEIEQLGLFVDVLDGPSRTLRLHDLFRDALRLRLRQSAPQRFAELCQRVSDTEEDPIRRIGLLLEEGAVERAAGLAQAHLPSLIVTAGAGTALHLLKQFPDAPEVLPELAYVRGLADWAQAWDFASMLANMERATRGFAARNDHAPAQLARAYAATALVALGRLDEASQLLRQLREQPLTTAAEIIVLNVEAWYAIDVGRHSEVAPLISRMLDLLQTTDRLDLWYQTTPALRMPGLPGMTPVLERHAARMLDRSDDTPTPLRTIAVLTQAWCALWRGERAAAVRMMDSAREHAAWVGQTGAVRSHLQTLAAVLAVADGQPLAAMASAEARYDAFSPRASAWHRYLLAIFAARIAACCEAPSALRAALLRVQASHLHLGPLRTERVTRPREQPLQAQQAWLDQRTDAAIGLWQQALTEEDAIDLMGQAAEVRVRLARALLRGGRLEEAAHCLMPVFLRAIVDGPGGALLAPQALHELAWADWHDAIEPAQVEQLRRWLAHDRTEAAGNPGSMRAGPATEHGGSSEALLLTARELEVLERIAAGDSNKLIARAFDLSLHTVKRHVANILGKLNVQTRGQAAAWYRERSGERAAP